MKKYVRILSLVFCLILLGTFLSACSVSKSPASEAYIKVNGEPLSAEYIGYFFYVAQSSMLSEAGHTKENSTDEDIAVYWETTEIEGRNAADVARDVAANNAVFQRVQYLKALDEGVSLSEDEKASIDSEIETTMSNNGGETEFNNMLSQMGTNISAYRQIITENAYISKLYEKYDLQGLLDISDSELQAYSEAHTDEIPAEYMLDSAKKEKFNSIAKQWEKEVTIVIDDEAMKKFDV